MENDIRSSIAVGICNQKRIRLFGNLPPQRRKLNSIHDGGLGVAHFEDDQFEILGTFVANANSGIASFSSTYRERDSMPEAQRTCAKPTTIHQLTTGNQSRYMHPISEIGETDSHRSTVAWRGSDQLLARSNGHDF